jgi:hypothetical protein
VKQNNKNKVKLGFVILCPNLDIRQLENTIESIKTYYSDSSILVVLSVKHDPKHITKVRNLAQLVVAEDNLIGMLNKGLELSICSEWNIIIRNLRWINSNLERKFFNFMESDKDIFFPITRKNWNFTKFDLNGLLLHKKAFTEVGEFPSYDYMDESKIMWAGRAIENGYKLKGINFANLN